MQKTDFYMISALKNNVDSTQLHFAGEYLSSWVGFTLSSQLVGKDEPAGVF